MGGRQIVLVSTAGFSVLNTEIFWREAKTKRLFSQCRLAESIPWYRFLGSIKDKKYRLSCRLVEPNYWSGRAGKELKI
jgi:hypothetical protein